MPFLRSDTCNPCLVAEWYLHLRTKSPSSPSEIPFLPFELRAVTLLIAYMKTPLQSETGMQEEDFQGTRLCIGRMWKRKRKMCVILGLLKSFPLQAMEEGRAIGTEDFGAQRFSQSTMTTVVRIFLLTSVPWEGGGRVPTVEGAEANRWRDGEVKSC